MSIYQLLNTLILALSIATILITLVAFIIFQIRRLNSGKKKYGHGFKLESIYFRRFAPHIEDLIKEWELENNKKAASKKLPFMYFKLGSLFGILAIILIITLTIGNLGAPKVGGKKIISEEVLNKRAEKISLMREKGLLEKFSFSASIAPNEKLLKPLELQSALNIELLKPIAIIKSPTLIDSKESKHKLAYKNWLNFFQKNKIPFIEVLASEKLRGKSSVFILPQLSKIKLRLASEIVSLHRNKEAAFLFTGPVGLNNSEGNTNFKGWHKEHWFEEFAGVEFKKNPKSKIFLASQFTSTKETPYQIPPGQVLPWTATDNRYSALLNSSVLPLAFETSYIGESRSINKSKVIKSILHRDHSLAWMAWDPKAIYDNEKSDETQDYFINQTLAILAKQPIAKSDWWPNGANNVSVISVDSEDEFENISNFLKIFKKLEVPATLFLVADLYEKHHDLIDPQDSNIEFASHGDNHDSFDKQLVQTQFNRIQNSRHIIEQFSARQVKGFRPPFEQFDDNTLDAVAANQLSYMFSGQQCYRYSPCELGNGTVIFPRTLLDDFALIKDRTLVSPTNMFNAMSLDTERVQQTGGAYFLSLHTQIFGVEPYLGMVENLLKSLKQDPKMQLMTFSDLADWWRQRGQIDLEIKDFNEGKGIVQLVNQGPDEVENFTFTLFNVKKVNSLQRDLASDDSTNCLFENNYVTCSVKKLGPEGKIEFEIVN